MVGGDHQNILLAQLGQESTQPPVKLRQSPGIAVNVSAVTVEHIKVHQIHKAQTVEISRGIVVGVSHAVGIALVKDVLRVSLTGENVVNFANGQAVQPGFGNGVQHGFRRRLQGEVVAVGGAGEAGFRSAHKGTGNDPAYAVISPENFPGFPAGIVQLLKGNHILMGRHLEHGVGGGVDDPFARFHVLPAVIPDHVGAGIGKVT